MIMNCKLFSFLVAALFCATSLFAQLGIKAGVNVADEINSFSQSDLRAGFNSANLTGYQIGLVYQAMPKKSGFGIEVGALLTQKGSSFSDSTSLVNVIKQGYKELNYLEVPLNLRYHLVLGFIGIYGFGGLYGAYALSGKTVDETTNSTQNATFTTLEDHMDYGYNVGAGIELFKKIQFGATISQGLKNTSTAIVGLPTPTKTRNRVYSVNLVYLF
jgi:hypothetical protein